MNFEKQFAILSYLAVFCGFFSLWISGTFGILGTCLFLAVMAAAWLVEGSRWQISERVGTVLIVLAIPVFYLGWRFQLFGLGETGALLAGILGRLILSLTSIKLLQRKSDRDWIFIFLMAFFQVLLAAGLSISAFYLGGFVAFVFLSVSSLIILEIRSTDRHVATKVVRRSLIGEPAKPRTAAIGAGLLLFICLLAGPLFFLMPRTGGAGFGGSQSDLSTMTGFSDTVSLGSIGRIQQNDETVMRVRLDPESAVPSSIYWRGVALDIFDHKSWTRSRPLERERKERLERDLVQIDTTTDLNNLTVQTVYLEPLDTSVIFGLPRPVAVQTSLPYLLKDPYGGVWFPRTAERMNYRILSDTVLNSPEELSSDNGPYPPEFDNYLQIPSDLDPRVAQLAEEAASGRNRYEKSRNIENYLKTNFGYTLEQKAAGPQPLADFLFNVREGHCEYFATAMAIMLRTQGIATRIVNGFSRGDLNRATNTYIVKQRHAHSWVEVYFPRERAWVTFDPTPPAGIPADSAGFGSSVTNLLETLEVYWVQYFVAFDSQEQRTVFATARRLVSRSLRAVESAGTAAAGTVTAWWRQLRGEYGSIGTLKAAATGVGVLIAASLAAMLFVLGIKKLRRSSIKTLFVRAFTRKNSRSMVEFYEQMTALLAQRGIVRHPHQTPAEFAKESKLAEVSQITELYHQVRFGERELSPRDREQVAVWLGELRKN